MNRLSKGIFQAIVRRHYLLTIFCGLGLVIVVGLGSCKSKEKEASKEARDDEAAVLAPPQRVQLKAPALSPSFSATPIFTVQGVEAGDTVRLFKAEDCNVESLLGSGVVGAGQNKVDITISPLPAVGNYPIYAQRTSVRGKVSACSAQLSSYNLFACPDESYAQVEGNAVLGVNAFCVFRTEAKNDGDDIPIAAYAGSPWVWVYAYNAKAACRRIEVEHGSCDLLSNPEWMAMAWDIETTAANWSDGVVGSGQLNRGHSDKSPDGALSIENPNNPWDQTEQGEETWSQKRTHVLSNGEIIWDLPGNIQEWVDWETGSAEFSPGPTTCSSEYMSPLSFTCEDLQPNDYLPLNPANRTEEDYMANNSGVGKVRGGPGGYALRGADWSNGALAGIFSLSLINSTNYSKYYGFRCVCRP